MSQNLDVKDYLDVPTIEEFLNASDKDFVEWARDNRGLIIKPERLERWKRYLWNDYIEELEAARQAQINDRSYRYE